MEGETTGEARVDYHPLFSNPHVNSKLEGPWRPHSETTTGPDGSYTLTVLVGHGVISVAARNLAEFGPAYVSLKEVKDFIKIALPPPLLREDSLPLASGGNLFGRAISPSHYNAVLLVNPSEKDKTLVTNAVLEAPRTLKGRVVDPDGRPLPGVTVIGLDRSLAWGLLSWMATRSHGHAGEDEAEALGGRQPPPAALLAGACVTDALPAPSAASRPRPRAGLSCPHCPRPAAGRGGRTRGRGRLPGAPRSAAAPRRW